MNRKKSTITRAKVRGVDHWKARWHDDAGKVRTKFFRNRSDADEFMAVLCATAPLLAAADMPSTFELAILAAGLKRDLPELPEADIVDCAFGLWRECVKAIRERQSLTSRQSP